MNENVLKKNIRKSWNLMLNGIDTPIDDYGNTALHLATIQNDYELVSLLLLKGANPNVRNNGNVKPRMIAKIMEFPDIYKVLLMHENANYMNLIADYSQKNDELNNKNNMNINDNNTNDYTKDNNNNSDNSNVTISNKINNCVTAGNSNSNTIRGKTKKQRGSKLLFSLNFEDREYQQYQQMLSQMPNTQPSNENIKITNSYINNTNTLNKTEGNTINTKRQSTFGSTINKVNEECINDQNTIYTNYSNVYERQKNHQNHKKHFPKYYLTVFDMAYLGIYKEYLYSLLDSKTIEETDENGSTPLMKACYNGHKEIVEKLLEKNANINACDKLGYTSLIWAALRGHAKICEILIKKGAGVNNVYGKGKAHAVITPLIAASYNGSKDTVITLINLGAEINKKVGPGDTTALMVATLKYRFEIVDELLKRGAEFDEDISWISNGAFFMKVLEKGHNHWMVDNNFIDSIIMDNGKSAISILSNLKNNLLKENSKKINAYTKQDKKNIKDMQSIYEHYILKTTNPEMKHVISSSIIKKNSSILSNENISFERNQKIKNKYSYIEVLYLHDIFFFKNIYI